jgi:hypothetical protein
MSNISFTLQHRIVGRATAWAVFCLGTMYAVTTVLGFRSLKSPDDAITYGRLCANGDPFFSIMELLIILIAPLMVVSMVAVHAYAPPHTKIYSLTALIFMILMGGITSSVHFVILTISRQFEATSVSWLLSFKWPSVVYALEILAWDWFFAISMLFAAPVFGASRLEQTVQMLMIVSGVLSLAGLIGVPLANMQVRNIGIIGYGVVAPVVFLLLGIVFDRTFIICRTLSKESKFIDEKKIG